jgi:hypothetical protein
VVSALLVAGCGGAAFQPPPPPLDAADLPRLSSRDRELPREVLAQDALVPGELAALLDDAGYAGGFEREFSGHTETFDHVIARTLLFADGDGASAYLDWVARHTGDLAGPSQPRPPVLLDGDRAIVFELDPCPTCKKQLPTWFGAWKRGAVVSYLLAAGRDVDRDTFTRLARRLTAP